MKKVLFATTAIVALGLLPLAAQAQDKKPAEKPISLTLGGYFRLHAITGWQDDNNANRAGGQTIRDHGIGRESEIWFRGETALDNGLRVGVQVELEGETSPDQIDNTYIYFQHANYGRLLLGEDFGSSVKTHKGVVGHTTGLTSISHFAAQGSYAPGLNQANVGGGLNTFMVLDGTNDKAIYDTPRLFGVRLSASYAPDDKATASGVGAGESGNGLNPNRNGVNHLSEAWTFAADYVETFGGLGVGLSAGIQGANPEKHGKYFAGRQFQGDPLSFNFGAEVSYAGFRVGAAYKQIENNVNAISAAAATVRGIQTSTNAQTTFYQGDREDFTVGVDYTFGRWTVGAHYGFVNQEIPVVSGQGNGGTSRYTDTLDQVGFGVNYVLGPGINLYAAGLYFDLEGRQGSRSNGLDSKDAANNDGILFILGTQLNF